MTLWNCFCITVTAIASFFFFQAEDGIRDYKVTGVQTCALPIYHVAVVHAEGHMDGRLVGRAPADPEVGLGRLAEARSVRMARDFGRKLHEDFIAQRRQGACIEILAALEVRYEDSRVVDHGCAPACS